MLPTRWSRPGAVWLDLRRSPKAYDAGAYPMAGLSDRGLPAVLGGLAICASADSESRVGGLRGHCGLEPDLFVFAVGRRAFRRVWPLTPTLSIPPSPMRSVRTPRLMTFSLLGGPKRLEICEMKAFSKLWLGREGKAVARPNVIGIPTASSIVLPGHARVELYF